LKKLLIVGSESSTGKRYQAILKYLFRPFDCYDPTLTQQIPLYSAYDGYIVCSPTDTHLEWVSHLSQFGKPILCEKPLTNKVNELYEFSRFINDDLCDLDVVLNYKYWQDLCPGSHYEFPANYYSYFNHGKDHIIYDCYQLIALTPHGRKKRSDIILNNTSPEAVIYSEGLKLETGKLDKSFVHMMIGWLGGARNSSTFLMSSHEAMFNMGVEYKLTERGYEWNRK